MEEVLWISPYVPYDRVNHAGGQTENFYIKGLKKYGFNIKVLSFCTIDEVNKIDLDEYGIKNDIILLKRDKWSKLVRTFKYNIFDSKYNPFNKYGNLVSNNFMKCVLGHVKQYKRERYIPDLIVLEWTEAGLLTKNIKAIYPQSKIICIEEDVAYLGYKRHLEYTSGYWQKKKWEIKYNNLKREELSALSEADFVVCLNEKDKKLLIDDGIDSSKLSIMVPYFYHYNKVERNVEGQYKLLFFGNMAREENYTSVMWFVDNVLPLIDDLDFEFDVVGAKPAEVLKKYESSKVHIVGFVDDVTEYFSKCLCLVAPLVLGAGIKIKILESLSAGIPVLTNSIGIEGIPAKNGEAYIHCEKPKDYESAIRLLFADRPYANLISAEAKAFIETKYSLEKSLENLCQLVENL